MADQEARKPVVIGPSMVLVPDGQYRFFVRRDAAADEGYQMMERTFLGMVEIENTPCAKVRNDDGLGHLIPLPVIGAVVFVGVMH